MPVVANKIFLTGTNAELEEMNTVVAKPTFNVAVNVNDWPTPFAFAPPPTILEGEIIKSVILHLSLINVKAGDGEVLKPNGAPLTVTASPDACWMLEEIPNDVVVLPAKIVEKLENIRFLTVILVTILLINTFDNGEELIVNVINAVCNPSTGVL